MKVIKMVEVQRGDGEIIKIPIETWELDTSMDPPDLEFDVDNIVKKHGGEE